MIDYIYAWGNNPKRMTLKGRKCRIIARLTLNSAVVEFENGQREVISCNALRKVKEKLDKHKRKNYNKGGVNGL